MIGFTDRTSLLCALVTKGSLLISTLIRSPSLPGVPFRPVTGTRLSCSLVHPRYTLVAFFMPTLALVDDLKQEKPGHYAYSVGAQKVHPLAAAVALERRMTRQLPSQEVLAPGEASIGEGPVLDARTGELAWVDIAVGALHRTDLSTGRTQTTLYDTLLGAVAPVRSGDVWAVAMAEGFAFLDGETMVGADLVLPEADRRMNDAKCDARGRLWAGSTTLDARPGQGALHCGTALIRAGRCAPG
jgi:hypothetical protein